jgi:hypothetical protein
VSVAVVVPWRGGCPERERAWAWVRARYAEHHPDWELIEAPGPDPWCKAAAVIPAIERTTADVVVVADADVWCDELAAAVDAVHAGEAWAIPHLLVHRLSAAGTAAVVAGAGWRGQDLAEPRYAGLRGGGIVVGHRDLLLSVPLDRRFVGWGQEDESWALALECLLGPPWRGNAPLLHLWHSPQPRMNRRYGSTKSRQLRRRYGRAGLDPSMMRALIEEGRHAEPGPLTLEAR